MSKKQQFILCMLLIFLLSLLTISWFGDGKLFFGYDANFPLDSQFSTAKSLFVWDFQFSLGQFNYRAIQFLFPYYLFWAGLNCTGLSLVYIESLWVIFLFSLTGFSMFYLFSTLFKNQISCIVPFVASVAYMFNLYLVNMWRFGQTTTLIAYAVAPLVLALLINGLNSKKYLKYAFLISLCTVAFSAGFTGLPYVTSLFLIPTLLYLLYYLLVCGWKSIKGIVKFLVFLAPLVIMANLFWIGPFVVASFSPANLLPTYGTVSTSYYDFVNPVPFYQIIQVNGFYAFHNQIGAYSAVPFAQSYSEFPLIFVSFLLIILAFSGFLMKTKTSTKEPIHLCFATLTMLGLMLSVGPNAPTRQIYVWLYLNVPSFWIFRSPYPDFAGLYAFGLACLIGLFVYATWLKLNVPSRRYLKYLRIGVIAAVIVLLLTNAYPLVNGDIKRGGAGFPDEQVAFAPLSVTIPHFYSDAGNWINSQNGDFNVLLLPYRNYLDYSWGYGGADIIQDYVHKSIITGSAGAVGNVYSSNLISQVYSSLGSSSFANLLAFINVRYVWFSRDLRTYGGLQNSSDVEYIENQLRNQDGIELVKVFGDVAIYENAYWVSNKVYVPSSYYVAQHTDGITGFAGTQAANKMVVFTKEQTNFNKISSWLSNNGFSNTPLVTYSKVSPTKYVVQVTNATQPFFLVFSESFDDGWVASVDGQQISAASHSIANGYANCWYIDRTRAFTVTIEFWPQNLFYVCCGISVTTLIISSIYLNRSKFKSFYKENKKPKSQ